MVFFVFFSLFMSRTKKESVFIWDFHHVIMHLLCSSPFFPLFPYITYAVCWPFFIYHIVGLGRLMLFSDFISSPVISCTLTLQFSTHRVVVSISSALYPSPIITVPLLFHPLYPSSEGTELTVRVFPCSQMCCDAECENWTSAQTCSDWTL